MSYGTAETILAAAELVLGEIAHRGVCAAERVQLTEEVREAGRPGLTNLLESVATEPGGRERRTRIRDGREGVDRPGRLREPSDKLDPVVSVGTASMAHPGSDQDGASGAENTPENFA